MFADLEDLKLASGGRNGAANGFRARRRRVFRLPHVYKGAIVLPAPPYRGRSSFVSEFSGTSADCNLSLEMLQGMDAAERPGPASSGAALQMSSDSPAAASPATSPFLSIESIRSE